MTRRQVNIRMETELHDKVRSEAEKKGITINQFVIDAVKMALNTRVIYMRDEFPGVVITLPDPESYKSIKARIEAIRGDIEEK